MGGVDVERLARDRAPARGRQGADGAHVVQPVGELDEDDADVARHRQQHLAEVLRLRLFLRLELDARDLGNAVHQAGDVGAELLDEFFLGGAGVLDDVVQDGGRQRARIQAHGRQDVRDRDGMVDVRFAAAPALARVGLGAEEVGAVDVGDVPRFKIGFEEGAQVADQEALRAGRFGARQRPPVPTPRQSGVPPPRRGAFGGRSVRVGLVGCDFMCLDRRLRLLVQEWRWSRDRPRFRAGR